MISANVKLPDSVFHNAQELARREGVSLGRLIASALAEKVAALLTVEYLKERAAKGSLETFRKALDKVPDVAPEEYDRL